VDRDQSHFFKGSLRATTIVIKNAISFSPRVLVLLILAVTVLTGAITFYNLNSDLKSETDRFFPLKAETRWSYSVDSRSQQSKYVIFDVAKGSAYVDKLHKHCLIVDETYNIDRGGTRPIIYCTSEGFFDRLSGLEYDGDKIEFPPFTFSDERHFLPLGLRPDRIWANVIHPFGRLSGDAPTISQSHKSFAETAVIVVPAGKFSDCVRVETTAKFTGGAYREPLVLQYFDWYAPDVGLVKTIAREQEHGGELVEDVELIEFHQPA
jgi:hypothetical protein